MESISNQARMYLAKLNTMSGGDPDVQISMYDLGDELGLDRSVAGEMAETLFIGGFAELKTLSGGIGITAMGLNELGMSAPVKDDGGKKESLGKEPILAGTSLETVHACLADLKAAIPKGGLDYAPLDEALTDIKTIEVQLLSPRPKTAVVREVFGSLIQTLNTPGLTEIKSRLTRVVSADR